MKSRTFGGIVLLSVLPFFARHVQADAGAIQVINAFDVAQGQLPESIVRNHDGSLTLSMSLSHSLVKLIPDGAHSPVLFATLPVPEGGMAIGVKAGRHGDYFACTATTNSLIDAAHVWHVSQKGEVTDYAHLNPAGFPNDIALDDDGTLYVTDTLLGLVYKIKRAGEFETWLSDPLLFGSTEHPIIGVPFGANGIALDRSDRLLYIANTDLGTILRVRIRQDGSPGPITVFASDPRLTSVDGIAFDAVGNLYAAMNTLNQIARVDRGGHVSLIAQGGPLDSPSAFAFASDGLLPTKLYITSFAISKALGLVPGTPAPSLDSLFVPFGGQPLP